MKTKTVQARKQRKARYGADLHQMQKFMHVHLSKELRDKYGKRNVQLRKGDKIKILRGQFKSKEVTVEKIDLKRQIVTLTGLEFVKKDGSKVNRPFKPSNLMIINLELSDKKRKAKLLKPDNKISGDKK
ncbi:50S ribosomal protein L24 [archaeon]|jgi:large subunit ribosomal protein L24|nr:50S ribosomal protein L24 [archaeon]MBT3450717.1 50S ribosomal protein L24 [archaeon]MBT6869209.1 50S ribosomal protein L24 [archaeon]MBT7193745.1 50S ribosomal protein L24 [archaeon]MBT7381392.1 50S ribosomal protein L24 [archaeon]